MKNTEIYVSSKWNPSYCLTMTIVLNTCFIIRSSEIVHIPRGYYKTRIIHNVYEIHTKLSNLIAHDCKVSFLVIQGICQWWLVLFWMNNKHIKSGASKWYNEQLKTNYLEWKLFNDWQKPTHTFCLLSIRCLYW